MKHYTETYIEVDSVPREEIWTLWGVISTDTFEDLIDRCPSYYKDIILRMAQEKPEEYPGRKTSSEQWYDESTRIRLVHTGYFD